MKNTKFRVWDNVDYMSSQFTLKDVQEGRIKFTDDCLVMQFTGLRDKNGKMYCQNDIVRHNEKNYPLILDTYKFHLNGFYESSQDNPTDFFSEEAYKEG